MAIRLRTVNGRLVALCAAETDEQPGDSYLDDSAHVALAAKFMRDFHKSGIMPGAAPLADPDADSQRVRDEDDEARRWSERRDEIVRRVLLHVPRALAHDVLLHFGIHAPKIDRHRWPDGEGECLNGCGTRRVRQGRASWRFAHRGAYITQGTACVVWGATTTTHTTTGDGS